MKTELRTSLPLTLLLAFSVVSSIVLVPGSVQARECSATRAVCGTAADCIPAGQTCDPVMEDYCITPPFIAPVLKPNLLMMIDNSASMYDLAYTDPSTHNFCANNPATSCATAGNTCAGAAICKITSTTSTVTTTSPLACTVDSDCKAVASGGTGVCPSGSTCSWGNPYTCTAGQCKKSTQSVSVTTTTPKACTTDTDCTAAGDSCNNRCTPTTTPCLDSTYSNAGDYPGYFKQTGTYCYSTKSNKTTCTYSGSYDEYDAISSASMPAACTYGGSGSTTPFVCVNTATDVGSGKEYVSQFVASGKFLNWLSMSKFDIEKSILTGGKYRTDFGGDLVGESRGCSGRKFIKTLPALPAISFGVRGGSAAYTSTSQATQYGQTFVEIYKGTYDAGSCTAAVNDWQNVAGTNLGPLQVDTKNCIGSSSDSLAAANQTIHDCFWYFSGHGLTNLQPIENVCAKIYTTTPPGDITDPNDPAAICSNNLSHTASLVDANTTGYIGQCFTAGAWNDTCALRENKDFCQGMGGAGAVADPSSESGGSQTVQNVPGFVMEMGLGSLEMINDYTRLSPVPANATKGFPLAVYDTMNFNPWPPTGLIQKYKDSIRFGIMTFQNNGSGSECNQSGTCSATSPALFVGAACTTDSNCSGGKCIFNIPCAKTCSNLATRQCNSSADCSFTDPVTGVASTGSCGSLANSDGGAIISYVGAGQCSTSTTTLCDVDADCASLTPAGQYCRFSIGDHNSGLLRKIDDIQATSWTPFGEAFYNALGYFARTNDYTSTPPTSRHYDASHPNDLFDKLPSPNTLTSFTSSKNPSQYKCQGNNILLVTDGMSTADLGTTTDPTTTNSASEKLAALYAGQVPYTTKSGTTFTPATPGYNSANNHGYDAVNKCPTFSGSRSVSSLAWVANNRNIKTLATTSPASTTRPGALSESVTTYVVYSGPQTSGQPDLCDPKTLMSNTATNGGTALLPATNPAELNQSLNDALWAVSAKAGSGTAASILNNSEGSGAVLLQAIFFPKKEHENQTAVSWSGELINLWYFVDPFFTLSTIREDTDYTSGTHFMDIAKDKRVQFFFDTVSNQTQVRRYNFDGTSALADMNPDVTGGLKTLWTAGKTLWKRDLSSDPRTIYTTVDSKNFTDFSHANASFLSTRLNPEGVDNVDAASRTTFAEKVIDFVHGIDVCPNSLAPCRSRTVDIKVSDTVTETHVWKLGDIISSTPKLQGVMPLHSYDLSPPLGYSDSAYRSFYNGANYKNRGMVYVGGNDGMLHAIKLGNLNIKSVGTQKATLSGVNLGREEWAFVPKNVMPYLKYLTSEKYNPGHLYLVDGANLLFDISTKTAAARDDYWNEPRTATTWKTVLLGGMGLGGASKNYNDTCSAGSDAGTCVKTPFNIHGFSSYFAIDVTNQDFNQDSSNLLRAQPTLLWEFSHPELGYSTSGPAIVRLNSKTAAAPFTTQTGNNGRWFAIYASGPTGPIDELNKQFKGKSDQNLKLFVVDIEKGPVVDADPLKNGLWIIDTGITNAFAGNIGNNAVVDAEAMQTFPVSPNVRQDDVVYIGYTQKNAGTGTWSDGGVLRLVIPDSANADVMDISQWKTSKVVSGIGPVTTAVSKLMSKNNLYLFFGTGRFFFPQDDMTSQRRIVMVKDKCYPVKDSDGNFVRSDIIDDCTETTVPPLTLSDLTPRSTASNDPVDNGWYIELDAGERVVTDTVSTSSGTVFYTSFKPTTDPCGLGGKSYLWGVKYDTGGTLPASSKTGKVLIQLSTGAFAELDLKTALSEKDGRRTAETSELSFGKASADPGLFMTSAGLAPVKRVLHIQERFK